MTTISSDGYTTVIIDGPVARLTLDRPANRNALTVELLESVLQGIDMCVDAGARALVLAASGPAFCAGLDLAETDSERLRHAISLLLAAMRRILAAPIPVLARVHGAARAGGLGLVAAADIAVASDEVTFAFPEARLGLAPSAISVCVLPRLRSRDASRLFLTSESVDARRAVELGLIDDAVAADALDRRIASHLEALVAAHPQGVRATKALLTDPLIRQLDERADDLVAQSWELFTSRAAREAIEAARRR